VPSFKGQYEHSVDSKGRVAFPAKLRKALSPEANEGFTIIRGLEACLYLYPNDEWEKVENKLYKVNSFKKRERTVIRNILRHAEDLALDKQNRISLPGTLAEFSNIGSSVVFIGMGKYIEIWNPKNLDKQDEQLTDEESQELTEEVLSDVFDTMEGDL